MEWTGGPTSRIVQCVLPLIAVGRAGLNIQALAADVIAADSRINIWFADQKRTEKSNEWWLDNLGLFEAVTIECEAAVHAFNEGGNQQELANALRGIAEKLTAIRS